MASTLVRSLCTVLLTLVLTLVWMDWAFAESLPESAEQINAQPNTESLSLANALHLAVNKSRLIDAGHLQIQASRDMAVSAAQRPDPILKVGVNNLPVNTQDRFSLTRDFMTMRSIGISQELTRKDKRRARGMVFEKEAEMAEANLSKTLINIQRDTVIAWLDRYYLEQMLKLYLQQKNETKQQLEAATATYRGGGAQNDVFAARFELARVQDRVLQVEQEVNSSKALLARWIGSAAYQPLGRPPEMKVVHFDEKSLEQDLLNHPDVELLFKEEAVALAEVDLAQANKKPDVSVEFMYSQRGPDFSNMASVNVSVPLYLNQANLQNRELSAKLASAQKIRAEREDAIRDYVAQTKAMLQAWQNNRARLKHYEESVLTFASDQVGASVAAYRGGYDQGANLKSVLQTRRDQVDAHIERLKIEQETARLWAQLEYLIPVVKEQK